VENHFGKEENMTRNVYELIEFGELKKEFEMLNKIETILMILLSLFTIGLIAGYFFPMLFAVSTIGFGIVALPFIFITERVSTLRIRYSIKKSSLHIDEV
jgi:uncharacterized membrane protein (DUF485 family)